MDIEYAEGSFRDPSGFIFLDKGQIYRQVNLSYKEDYDFLISSGLYEDLSDSRLLISHKEVDKSHAKTGNVYKIIRPKQIQFISYPYEWCFSQLKEAGLITLQIQKRALALGMTLKDCSAYNIQFIKGRPIFIDTLSFERYEEGRPWPAYRQFCQHFLAPLALMSYCDVRLSQLLRTYIDGLPMDLASGCLPMRTRFKAPLLFHIHFHARSQKIYSDRPLSQKRLRRKMSLTSFLGLLDSLSGAVESLKWNPQGTSWSGYYKEDRNLVYDIEDKKKIIEDFLDKLKPGIVWDLGSNTGIFSRIASDRGVPTISFDSDPGCVEINYLTSLDKKESEILPLLLDLINPSPDAGWENKERMSLLKRGPADTVFALALIHHLAISNNLPFCKIAGFLCKICDSLIIEFVPKDDPNVQKLLEARKDMFPGYSGQIFEKEFSRFFSILSKKEIGNSKRVLYLMQKR